ncbi:ABC transporter permease [Candidatus Bathyarchaeota archaeon]|nr:ABC transporter permease [Candidatus Bathyarchaeota archaeon]MBS7631632.1 ABC transporter permease [Candidatus Bathyarchaeota archaeon]
MKDELTIVSKREELQRAWAIAVKDMKIYYLRPPAIVFGILFPFTLFLSFAVGRNIPMDRLMPALVAQTVFWASSSIGPVSIPMERRLKTFDRYLSAPISLVSVLLGKTLAGTIFGIAISALSLLFGLFALGTVSSIALLLLGIIISSFGFSAMGIMFASIPSETPGEVMMPMTFVRIPLLFISGLYIPLDQLPPIGLTAAFFSPLTHTLDLIKLGIGGYSFFGVAANIAMLLLYTGLFIGIGINFHRRIMRRE